MITTLHSVKSKIIPWRIIVLKRIGMLLTFLFVALQSFSGTPGIPEKPKVPRLVNNFTNGFISRSEEMSLETKLTDFENKTSNQITIVIIDDLAGFEPSDFATKILYEWEVGQTKEDNGVVVLVKPKTTSSKGQAFITTGYGLEGAIPDAICKRIVENELIPNFKNGDNYKGLDEATTVLMKLAIGEYNSSEYGKKKKSFPIVIIVIIIIIIVIVLPKRRNGGGGMTMSSAGWWILSSMLNSGGRSSGGWGGGSSGGGFGGGGFGGFGGGSGGGGGAGGSW
jgi:uncharacterized protein